MVNPDGPRTFRTFEDVARMYSEMNPADHISETIAQQTAVRAIFKLRKHLVRERLNVIEDEEQTWHWTKIKITSKEI